MSQALTLARPYARAAFAVARERGQAAAWSEALAFTAQAVALPDVAALLDDPRLDAARAAALLQPPSATPEFAAFLQLLADNRRLALLPEVAGLYEQLRAEVEGRVQARMVAAVAPPDAEIEAVKAALKRRFQREVELEVAVDPALIGGAVIQAGDVVIDGSLKGKLARLQTALLD